MLFSFTTIAFDNLFPKSFTQISKKVKSLAMEPGIRSGPTFCKIDKNCISIFSQCFQEPTKNAGKKGIL